MSYLDYFSSHYLFIFGLIFPILTGKWSRERSEELAKYRTDNIISPVVTISDLTLQFFYHYSANIFILGSFFILCVIFLDTFFWRQPLISVRVFMAIWLFLAHVCLYFIIMFITRIIDEKFLYRNSNILQKDEFLKAVDPELYKKNLKELEKKALNWVNGAKKIIIFIFVILYLIIPVILLRTFIIEMKIDRNTKELGLKFKHNNYIAYNPTSYNPVICDPGQNIPVKFPLRISVRKDLMALRNIGFTGLLTFSTFGPESVEDYIPPILYAEELSDLGISKDYAKTYFSYINDQRYYRLKDNLTNEDRRKLIKVFKNKFISLSEIPAIAQEVGFNSVILGIWYVESNKLSFDDVCNKTARLEMSNAIAQSSRKNVDAYCIGHNQLNISYDIRDLKKAIENLRGKTCKPVSTSQPVMDYYINPDLFYIGDWFCPDIHGYWYALNGVESQIKDPSVLADAISKKAGEEILTSVKQLQEQFLSKIGYKPVLIKFIGFPSTGKTRFSDLSQEIFFDEFLINIQKNTIFSSSNISFSYFDAFDTPWKEDVNFPEEAHIGFFTIDRQAKPAAKVFKKFH
ncbi:MAG: hypothetical protein WC578_03635 [Candidatus Omnitrophota bacterium]